MKCLVTVVDKRASNNLNTRVIQGDSKDDVLKRAKKIKNIAFHIVTIIDGGECSTHFIGGR